MSEDDDFRGHVVIKITKFRIVKVASQLSWDRDRQHVVLNFNSVRCHLMTRWLMHVAEVLDITHPGSLAYSYGLMHGYLHVTGTCIHGEHDPYLSSLEIKRMS